MNVAWIARALAAIGMAPADGSPARETAILGRRGERLAARMLRRQGYQILGRNLRLRVGEADILCVAPDRRTVVLVEVKTRQRGETISLKGNLMTPEASVHAQKRQKLVTIARSLARANGWHDRPVRIDVVAVEWPETGRPVVRHHEGAVPLGGRPAKPVR